MDLWFNPDNVMPEEHTSHFAQYANTSKWKNGMFMKCSDKVLVTVEYANNGLRFVRTAATLDGKWRLDLTNGLDYKIIAWMPFPNPCDLW